MYILKYKNWVKNIIVYLFCGKLLIMIIYIIKIEKK